MIKKLYKYIVLFALAVPCMAMDGDFCDVMRRIQTGEFIVQLKQEKLERKEKHLMDQFTSSIGKKNPTITIDQYDNWKMLTCNAILAGYNNFIKLLVIHIESNSFVQIIINTISYFPHMKEPLAQLCDQLPVLKKYMSKELFRQA